MATVASPEKSTLGQAAASIQQPPSPERILETFFGPQKAFVLKAAVDLDVFTAMAEGPVDVPSIAKHSKASERGIRILCDFLTVHGFLVKEGATYSLAPDSAAFLSRKSPTFMGSVGGFIISDYLMDRARAIKDSIVRGRTAVEQDFDSESPMWVEFAKHMAPMMFMPAQLVAQALAGKAEKILDIAAGHGLYGILLAQHNPGAQVYAVDWKGVVHYAQENAQKMGIGEQYHLIPGSAFEVEFGSDFDVVLIPNFLHHFDAATNTKLLQKVKAALKSGGRVAIVEFVPNDDRVSPPIPAAFSMTMLAGTESGDAYTFAELSSILERAGFNDIQRKDLAPTPATLVMATA